MFRQIFAPPIFEDDEKTRIAALLNSILWAVILIGAVYTIVAPIILGQYFSAILTASIVIIGLTARQLMVRGYIRAAAVILLAVFNLVLIISIIISDGIFGASYFGLVMTTVIAGVLLGGRSAYIVAIINSLMGLGIMLAQNSLPDTLIPQTPVTFFSSLVVYVFFIAALLQASARGFDKLLENLRNAQEELTRKNQELQAFSANLENTVTSRTAELDAANQRIERRASQFEAISQVSRVINQAREIESLLPQVTQVISQQFGFYHVGVFLMDANSEYAVLIAANSSGGQKMLARNHKLKVGQTGIVGYVAGTGLPRIALDTGADAIYFNNPDLPETRSEMALPLLRQGREIIGVLDVQSREQNAYNQEDVRILTTLADQVSIAIENARLFEQSQQALQEAETFYRGNLKDGWMRFTRSKQIMGVQRRSLRTSFLSEPVDIPGMHEAVRSGSVYRRVEENENSTRLTFPMKLRGQVVGVLNVKSGADHTWSRDEMDIISAIMERAALSIENARLLEESRKVAEREHAIGEISTKISAGTEIEAILRTAVRELGAHISGAQVTVEIGDGEK
ncbi:MAG: GAF domain-containing protein [Anaerolineales bacterium]|nr:GAF domain-containing protein [Anaerolineales bacterium]